jgi:hypothetical protein
MKTRQDFQIRPARLEDVPIILQLIRDLATYERAPDEVTANEQQLVDVFFSRLKASRQLGSQFTFIIFPPGLDEPGFISKTCS